ncbi:CBS domain-containing protein [bacterium]|nr:CBS domain-containing protein [bacterium]
MKTAEEILKEKGCELVFLGSQETVAEALKLMAAHKIGSVLVKDGNVFRGIYTEKDLVRDAQVPGFNPGTTMLKKAATSELVFAPHDTAVYSLQDLMLGKRLRHVLVMKEGRALGLLSIGDLTRAVLNEKKEQLSKVSWSYYEDWKWKK